MNTKLAEELVKTRRAVKQKYSALKSELAQTQIQLEKKFKPISEPLQKLLQKVEPLKTEIKNEPISAFSTPRKIKDVSENIYSKYLPPTGFSFLEDTYSNIPNPADLTTTEEYSPNDTERENRLINESVAEAQQQLEDLINTPAYKEYLESFNPLPRQYVDESIRGDEELFDRYYGLSHDPITEKFSLANKIVKIEGPDIILDNIRYSGTPGIYELLFKKQPIGYTKKDLDQYMDILKRTNAYRRNFDPDSQIQGTQLEKYRTIIKPYLLSHNILKHPSNVKVPFKKPPPPITRLRSKKGGHLKPISQYRMMKLSDKPIEYVYYDDPNEIVDRLRLLIASQSAGNDSHGNEIISVIEELKEAKIIK